MCGAVSAKGQQVDIQNVPDAIVATTDPSASQTLFELDRAMGQIAEEQRQVILLIGLEGMSYDDAATAPASQWARSNRTFRAAVTLCAP